MSAVGFLSFAISWQQIYRSSVGISVCVSGSWFVKDCCISSESMTPCRRSLCQPLALHQRQRHGDRKRKIHESQTGGWRGLVLHGIWPVWGDRCFCVDPPMGWTDRCVQAALACCESQESSKLSLTIFSLLFTIIIMSSSSPHHASLSRSLRSRSLSCISSLRLPFSLPSFLIFSLFLQYVEPFCGHFPCM